jgi:hypothetical protein
LEQADDERLTAAIAEEVTDGVAHGAFRPESAEDAFIVGVIVDDGRDLVGKIVGIGGAAESPAGEGGDRSRQRRDRADATGEFFDIDARVSRYDSHDWSGG